MSTLSKFRRLRVNLKITTRGNTIICLEITPHKLQKPHPTTRQENPRQKGTVSADLPATCPKICRARAPNEKLPTQISGEITALQAS